MSNLALWLIVAILADDFAGKRPGDWWLHIGSVLLWLVVVLQAAANLIGLFTG